MAYLSKYVNLAQHLDNLCHVAIQLSLAKALKSVQYRWIVTFNRLTLTLVDNGLSSPTKWLTLHFKLLRKL